MKQSLKNKYKKEMSDMTLFTVKTKGNEILKKRVASSYHCEDNLHDECDDGEVKNERKIVSPSHSA